MKKLFLYIFVLSFAYQMVPENESNGVLARIREAIHGKNTLFSVGKYSIPEGKAIMRVWGLVAIFILLKNLKKILMIKSYVLSKYRREKTSKFLIEPSWVYPDYVKNKYSQEVEKKLLKCREQLWQGYKNLLEQFREDMNIDNQKFVEYLITESEGEENYLEKEHGRTRFIDQRISDEVLNFINTWLSNININSNNVDLYVKKLKRNKMFYTEAKVNSKLSFILEERKGELIDISYDLLSEYTQSLNQLNNNRTEYAEQKITYENITQKNDDRLELQKLKEELQEFTQRLILSATEHYKMKYEIFGTLLHEIGHILMHHVLLNTALVREKLFKFKNIQKKFDTNLVRYQEFMADSLLPLLHEDAAKIMLKEHLMQAISERYEKKSIYFHEHSTSEKHLSQKSRFILCIDVVKLYGITLENCLDECFNEMKILISKQEFDSIYRNLHGIYKSANPEFYVQKHTNDEFKFPRFLPHFLEKQFPEDVAIKK